MNFKHMRVSTKLWLALIGLLLLLSISNMWGQSATVRTLEQARHDVQRIENKVTAVLQVKATGLRLLDTGVALIAATDATYRSHLNERFGTQAQQMRQTMQEMRALLVLQEDIRLFQAIEAASDRARQAREQAERDYAPDDAHGRAAYAFGQYAAYGQQYEAAIQAFLLHQQNESKKWIQVADDASGRTTTVAWIITVTLLLMGMLVARWLVGTITRPLQIAIEAAEHIGAGDLRPQARTERQDEFGQLLAALDSMALRLSQVIGQVRVGVEAVSSAAGQIASGNQDLSGRTEESAASLQQTAAGIEQMSGNVTQTADSSQQANQLAVAAVQAAERGGEVVQQVVMSMDAINTSSRKISDIISVIDGIAFQTNILALNAAVEAARAGEQGRGFAVVAGEVRTLAQRSAQAAKEIASLIHDSVSTVETGAQQVEQAGATMHDIVDSVRRVTTLIGEVTNAASEQRTGFAQINQAVGQLDQMTQQNAALVEESSAAANAMHEQAQRLRDAVSIFQVSAAAAPLAPR